MSKESKTNFGLVSDIYEAMIYVDNTLDLVGFQKKQKVMNFIKTLSPDSFRENKELYSTLIDFIVYLSKHKNEILINQKKIYKLFSSCCK